MDKIYLNDLKIDTIIGVFDWEREIKQTLQFDLEMDWDIAKAAESDDLDDTLDYGTIAKHLVALVEASRYALIETLAEKVCEMLLAKFPMPKVTLTLTKPVTLHGDNFAKIVITRSR